jgi:hypothetical protein
MTYIPSAMDFTLILVGLTLVLLLFPSLLAWWSKRKALKQIDALLKKKIKDGQIEAGQALDDLELFYETSTDIESISASTRMAIAAVALLIVGIGLFELISLYSVSLDYFTFYPSSNVTVALAQANYSQYLLQLISTVLGILGGVLSAAVGFFFGSKASADRDQTAAKDQKAAAAKRAVERSAARIKVEQELEKNQQPR